jgi:hypothetical protein
MKIPVCAMALASIFVSVAGGASAQEQADPADSARFQWGPLRFTPGITVSNVGMDNNVFNDPETPRPDTTAAIGPAVNLWTHVGALRVSGKSSGQYLYFKTYDNQRSWNTSDELRLELPMARLKPFAAGSYLNTRNRPGYEIDSRARAATNTATFGTDLRLSGRTTFVLSGSRTLTAFDQNETFLGAELAQALNRRSDTEHLQMRYILTPLTTVVVNNDAIQDRFDFEPARNADSLRLTAGFEFKPLALISGTAAVGLRHFNALNDAIPDFNGVVASADAKYNVSATQLHLRLARDLTYSYEAANPYYTLTDVTIEATERITRTWDTVGRAGWQSLDYRHNNASAAAPPRTDTGTQYGVGIGYRLGESFRLGVDANYFVRRSVESFRQYDGLRVGASMSYGLSQ